MTDTGLAAASIGALLRRLDPRRWGTGRPSARRLALIAAGAAVAVVALVGLLHPLPAAGGQPQATTYAVAAAPTGASSVLNVGDATAGINWLDLITKGVIVLVLLFITLRVLGRMQGTAPKRGSRLSVLESRTLAPKASLHLVAIGDRRLVVGLTPSGMVSLAELDAAELEAEAADAGATDDAAALLPGPRGIAGSFAGGSARPALGTAIDALLKPVDAFSGRLATLLGGDRVR